MTQKKVKLGNKIYDSLKEASAAIGQSPTSLKRAIENEWSVPVSFYDEPNPFL